MYILVKENDVIMNITETLNRQEETNYYLVKQGNSTVAIPDQFVKATYLVPADRIPVNIEPEKYCYNENDGFYKNKDFKQYYSPEDRIAALEDMVNMLLLGGE